MLVLSRKKGESIIIQDNIEITILEVNADTVKIGINAPRDIEILRKEIFISIQETNLDAVGSTTDVQRLKNLMEKNKKNSE